MAFKRIYEKKGLSLTSLIDIIFLLLIFFMATLNMSSVVSDRNQGIYTQKKFDLPEIRNRKTAPVQEILYTLMLQIEHEDPQNVNSPLVVYALWPSRGDSMNISQAKLQAIEKKRYAYFLPESERISNPKIPDVSPYVFISDAINGYADRYYRSADPKNHIEVRAIQETKYQIINHILNTCASLGDRIQHIYIRTLSGE
ncbi:biopolymer transporter ExbD [bacterium]|nr:biopolymer transporter ExbD [bacterium]RQV98222.1 MAG: hypothetical protein EH221_02300 [bacterium]